MDAYTEAPQAHRMMMQNAVDLVIMGDLNHPEIDWESVTTEKSINHSSQHFIDAIRDAYLYQHVTQPTRYRHSQNPNFLDLILKDVRYGCQKKLQPSIKEAEI